MASRWTAKFHFLFGFLLNRRSDYIRTSLDPHRLHEERCSDRRTPITSWMTISNAGPRGIRAEIRQRTSGISQRGPGTLVGSETDAMTDELTAKMAR